MIITVLFMLMLVRSLFFCMLMFDFEYVLLEDAVKSLFFLLLLSNFVHTYEAD